MLENQRKKSRQIKTHHLPSEQVRCLSSQEKKNILLVFVEVKWTQKKYNGLSKPLLINFFFNFFFFFHF